MRLWLSLAVLLAVLRAALGTGQPGPEAHDCDGLWSARPATALDAVHETKRWPGTLDGSSPARHAARRSRLSHKASPTASLRESWLLRLSGGARSQPAAVRMVALGDRRREVRRARPASHVTHMEIDAAAAV